jgi:hypothetical protein
MRVLKVALCVLAALTVMGASGCDQGIGMSVPGSGARWGGGSGPDVLVGGGPVSR